MKIMKRYFFHVILFCILSLYIGNQDLQSQITYRDFPQRITFECLRQDYNGEQWNSVAYGVKRTYVYDERTVLQKVITQTLDSNDRVEKCISEIHGYRLDGLPDFIEWRSIGVNADDSEGFKVLKRTDYDYEEGLCVRREETEFDTVSNLPKLSKRYEYNFLGKDSVEITFSVMQNRDRFREQNRKLYVCNSRNNENHYKVFTSHKEGDSVWNRTHKCELWIDGFVDIENQSIQGRLIRSEDYDRTDIPEMEWQVTERFQSYASPESLWFDSCVRMKKHLLQWQVTGRNTFQISEEGNYIKEEYNYHDNGLLKNHLRQVYHLDNHGNMISGIGETDVNGEWERSSIPNNVTRFYGVGEQLYEIRYNGFANYVPSLQDAVSFVAEYVSLQVGYSPFNHEPAFSVYPNPTQGKVFPGSTSQKIVRFEVVDTWGRVCLQKRTPNPRVIDLSALPNGLYFIKLYTESGCGIVKVVKQ